MLMARDFHCGFKIAVYARTVCLRRVVEPEGVSKFPPALSRKASVHAATFSHFRHIGPSSGWVGYRRGEETAPCPACPPREVRRLGRLGLSRLFRRCTGLRRKPLDQDWRGRNSIWVEGVGCEEVVT